MIEFPLSREFLEELVQPSRVKTVLYILQGIFGPVGSTITTSLAQVKGEEKFLRLAVHAATCASLQDFEQRLREELQGSAPISKRERRASCKSSE